MSLNGTRFALRFPSLIVSLAFAWHGLSAVANAQEPAAAEPAKTPAAEAQPAEKPPGEAAPAEEPPPEAGPAEKAPAPPTPAEAQPAEKPPAPAARAEAAPVEKAPAEAPAKAEPEPAKPEEAKPDFSKLAEEEVAEGLKLTAEQHGRIAVLLAERNEALAAAEDEEAKTKILQQSDQKLADVLTEVQLADFLGKPVPKRLRLSFRYQLWEEVLQWLTDEAGWSLVIPTSPPPGTFNYTDPREYTPDEVLDLMNAVLIHQGYTLIRRDQMLMVISLERGIPEGVVPEVRLEDLPKRGKHELVTLRFDLGRRPADKVVAAIEPLLGPYGKATPIPTAAEILVTDTAGRMPSINEVIQSIAEPEPTPPTPKPESPRLEVYTIKVADPETVKGVLTQLLPSAQIAVDPKTGHLNVHATPSQQTVVQGVLEKMDTEAPAEKTRVLEVYPIDGFLDAGPAGAIGTRPRVVLATSAAAAQLLKTLQELVPEAQLSINEENKTLVAFATPGEQETIKQALEKLKVERAPEETPQLEVYRLTRVDPETTLNLLQELLPDARLAIDPQTRSLVAVAVPSDQGVIRSTLKILQPEEPGPDTPEPRFYELPLAMPPSLVDVIQKVAPGSLATMDAAGNRLMVVATPTQHTKIEKTIEHMKKTTFIEGRSKLVVYPVTPTQRKRFEAILTTLTPQLPGIQVIADGTPGELAIWAKPQQHDVIQEILDELKRDVPHEEKFQLVAYPIRSADPQSALEMLQTLFPETKLVLDPKAGRLMVWTSPSEQESVKAALEQIEAEAPEDQKPRFEAYPVYGIGAGPSAAGLLQGQMETLVPNARFTFDSVTTKLIAFATPEEHQLITSALAKLGRGGTAEAKPTVEVYPLTKAEPTSTLSLLQTLVPEAELSLGPQQGSLVAMASQEDHQTIKATLEKLQPAEPGPEAPEVRFYPLEQAAPANLLTVLQSRAPNAEITADPQREGLLVMASPADHKVIQAAVEQFKQAVPPEEEPQLKVYAVTPAQRARFESVQSTLAAELGDVKIVPGGRPNELCIWATPGDHKLITGLLEQMKEGLPAEGEYQLTAYPVKSADPANVLSMLQTLYPETQIVLDAQSRRLLVWTSPQEHASIKASLEQIEAELPPEEQPRFESYPIYGVGTAADLPTLVSTLQTLVPKAQITADTTGRRLIVWGTPEEHEKLQGAISNLGRGGSPETTPVITVYPLTKADPQSTVTLLQNLVPGAQINVDAETGSLVALAVPADQQLIKSTLEQLQPEEPGPNTPVLRLHPLKKEPPSNLVTALNGLVPKAQVTLDSENMQLMAVATLSDHEVIQKTIEEFEASAAERPELRFHLLVREPPADLLTILQGLVPKATVSLDVENKRLMAVATPEDHEIIRATVEEYEASTPPEEPSKLMVYTVTPAQRDRFEALLPNLAEDLPGVQIIAGGEPDELAIWARPTEQLVIADIIEQLKRDVPLKEQRKLVAYPVKSADPSSVLQVLQTLYPNTQFVLDPKSSRLMVWTRPEEHDSIKASLEEIEAGVSPEERPRFEAFTLPVADTSTIVATLQPLVPNARLTIDTRTKQLIAWGTPTELEIVRKAVERLAVGKTSDFMPRLEVYPLTSADPTTAMTLLQSLVPDAEITLDAQSNRLIIRAVPSDHEVIKSTLAKIEGEGVVDSRPRFESYPILGLGTAADAQTFIATLQPLVPNARLTIDAKNKNLIAWGTPKEQEAIGKAVERLGQGGSPENRPTIEAYRLARADPQAALTLLENLVPDAQLSVDAQTGSVVALAVPDDHATIKAAVERIDAEAPAEEQPRFEAYPIRGITSATGASAFIAALQPLVPKAKLTLDAKYKNLIAWGTPKEHEAIRSAVERLGQGGTPETTPIVEVYRLTRASPATTLTLLQNLLPDAQLSVDSDTNNLVALAVPADQEVIKSTLDRLQPDKPGPDTPVLQFHPVRGEPSSNLVSVVQQMVPRAQITLDAENRCIMAVASPSDQQTIEATIRQFEIGAADLPQLRFHPLAETPPADLLTVLQQLAPRAQITVDSENKRVMAVASSDDHDKIRATIEQYELSTPPEEPGKLAVYSVTPAQRRRFEALLPTLSDELPDVQILGEGEPGELAVWATPTQHLLIQGIIDQIKQGAPDEAGNRLVAYPIKSADPQSVLTMLQRLFPDSDLVLDDKTDRLLAWTTPSEHERIKAALEAMDTGEPGDLTEQLIVYPISPDVDPTVAIQMLQQVVPEVQLLSDAKAGTIYAWARKADHQVIAEALEKMEAGQAEDRKPQLVVYPAGDIDSSTLAIMLSILVPQARVAVDSKTGGLAAYATPNDHEAIRAAIAEMAKEEVAAAKPTLETYSLESMTATAAIGVLSSAVPTARYSAGADAHQLLAWAKPSDHQMIQTILEQISREEPPETAPRLEVVQVRRAEFHTFSRSRLRRRTLAWRRTWSSAVPVFSSNKAGNTSKG